MAVRSTLRLSETLKEASGTLPQYASEGRITKSAAEPRCVDEVASGRPSLSDLLCDPKRQCADRERRVRTQRGAHERA
jgi:hypothetical protein